MHVDGARLAAVTVPQTCSISFSRVQATPGCGEEELQQLEFLIKAHARTVC